MSTLLSIVHKGTNAIFKAVTVICGLQLVFMVFVVSAQVFLRSFFKISIKWGEELVLIAMVWLTFLTLAIGLKEDLHITISIFSDRLPLRLRQGVRLFDDLVLLFTSICMIYYGWVLAKFTMLSTLPATNLPTAVTYSVVVVAGILCAIVMLPRLLARISDGKNGLKANRTGEGDQ